MSLIDAYTHRVRARPAPHPSALEPVPRHRPRYRWRSWLRACLPMPLAVWVPLGTRDCGQHEWRRGEGDVDICYHCLVGERPHQPIDVPIDDDFRMSLVRWAATGNPVAVRMIERFHANDRALGRPRWRPPGGAPAAR